VCCGANNCHALCYAFTREDGKNVHFEIVKDPLNIDYYQHMPMQTPRESIPNLDPLYNTLRNYIKEHQGDQGYINTDSCLNGRNLDTIYGIKYCQESEIGEERIVFGVRVRNDDIEVLMKPWMRTFHNCPEKEEYTDDHNWDTLKSGDTCYYIPTLFSIAETIEEYTNEK